MLLHADDAKVYKFLDALVENGQPHVADILRETGNLFHHQPELLLMCLVMQTWMWKISGHKSAVPGVLVS